MNIGNAKKVISHVAYDVFLATLSLFVISFMLEAQWNGVVARWVNINTILLIAFFSGCIALLTALDDQLVKPPRVSFGYWIGTVAISSAAGWIAWNMSLSLGSWAGVAGAGVGLIIFLMSVVLAAQTSIYE
ncbi:hypothetical protein HYV71_00920 [Candidatus Uhrbacteria bacterium]|nr:hypothetical protein [Candidatus Uhrbacteria bacterium]